MKNYVFIFKLFINSAKAEKKDQPGTTGDVYYGTEADFIEFIKILKTI